WQQVPWGWGLPPNPHPHPHPRSSMTSMGIPTRIFYGGSKITSIPISAGNDSLNEPQNNNTIIVCYDYEKGVAQACKQQKSHSNNLANNRRENEIGNNKAKRMRSASPQNKSSSTNIQILTNTHNSGSGKLTETKLVSYSTEERRLESGEEAEVWRGGIAEQVCKSHKFEKRK
ncbi:hypothetical protein SLEP1_g46970, partial [Rubroshorea leprosula]